jgi:hypothetical protein
MPRRVVSVFADETCTNRFDIHESKTVLELKTSVKEGLKDKLGLTDDSFNPSALTSHADVVISGTNIILFDLQEALLHFL